MTNLQTLLLQAKQEEVITLIEDYLARALPDRGTAQWLGWPGTRTLARAAFSALQEVIR